MKKILKYTLFTLLAAMLLTALLAVQTWYFKPLSINWFYTRVFLQEALDKPELLTQLRILEPLGLRAHNAHLDDESQAHQEIEFARARAALDTLHRYDGQSMSGQDRISYDVFDHFAKGRVAAQRWRYHDYLVTQYAGIHTELPFLMVQAQQINDATDAEHYIGRMKEFPRKFSEVIAGIRISESKGIVPPKFAVEATLDQIRKFLEPGVQGNTLLTHFAEQLNKIPADQLDPAKRAALLAGAQTAVKDQVFPAYQSLAQCFESLRAKATRNDGVWALPDGAAYYQYTIEQNTTTTMSAEALHQIGLIEVARIGKEMDQILTDAGYTEGSRAERMQKLATAPSQIYPNTPEGRSQIIKDYQAIIDEITAGLDPLFHLKPKARVEVKRVPEFTEQGAPAAYYQGAPLDDSRPGVFFINLRELSELPRFSMRTLSYHEAVPGHHLQGSIAQEVEGLPIFRRILPFTAYAEGWALYAERLAWEAGYEKNPLDNLGRLRDEMFRATRLVVDTGLHAKRWTREQAIDYMLQNTGMSVTEVTTEIERYLVNPGQALAYKVGMIKILELRERAKTALGQRFDIREFHDEILKNGAMPLTVLERVIDEYIDRKRKS